MIRRIDETDFLLINRALGIEQNFVQAQQRIAELEQGALNSFLLRRWLRLCFPNHGPNNNTTPCRRQYPVRLKLRQVRSPAKTTLGLAHRKRIGASELVEQLDH